jgi:hypothetical protein
MKATGMKPEHVILAVKGIGYEANLGLAAAPLIEQMVTWGIEQYFKP